MYPVSGSVSKVKVSESTTTGGDDDSSDDLFELNANSCGQYDMIGDGGAEAAAETGGE